MITVKTAKVAVSGATFAIDKPYSYLMPDELKDTLVPGMRVIVPFGRGNRKIEGMVLQLAEEKDPGTLKFIVSALDDEPIVTGEQIKLLLWMRERCFCTFYDCLKAMLPAGIWYTLRHGYRFVPGVSEESAMSAAGDYESAKKIVAALIEAGGECLAGVLSDVLEGANIAPAIKRLTDAGVIESVTHEIRKVKDKTAAVAVLAVSPEDAQNFAARKRKSAAMQAAVAELLAGIESAPVKEICYFTGASVQTIKALERAGMIRLEYVETYRRPEYGQAKEAVELTLNAEQETALSGLKTLLNTGKAEAALLCGVTGSGKTVVYIKLIEEAIAMGRGVLVLVPEIALTPQMLSLFAAYFGDSIALLHSSLGIGERYDEWKRIRSGAVKVVVGTRSAVFAPMPELGLIIIDEEQEHTYKSENAPRYSTRDIAKFRCVQSNALLLLGSATPSLESMYSAKLGRYRLFSLEKRYNNSALPEVIVADMKKELKNGNNSSISSVLRAELQKNIDAGEQSILFINRRGTSSIAQCPECGFVHSCPNCSVSLTYHSANGRMLCHHCGYSEPLDDYCPECGTKMRFFGAGTQKVTEELNELFPDVEILRMDADSLTSVNTHEAMFSRFEKEKIPILVGTQMVAKGLNFENVTLVGVVSVDQSLYASDYRAQERTFSLITQVVGRSGRAKKPGRAVLQTFTPENEIIRLAAAQDYASFYEREISLRSALECPPLTDMFVITVSGLNEDEVFHAAVRLKNTFQDSITAENPYRLLGPVPAAIAKVNNKFRYELTLTGANNRQGRELTAKMLKLFALQKENRGLFVSADINPLE